MLDSSSARAATVDRLVDKSIQSDVSISEDSESPRTVRATLAVTDIKTKVVEEKPVKQTQMFMFENRVQRESTSQYKKDNRRVAGKLVT